MTDPNFVILYVENPVASSVFYSDLLGHAPTEAAPTFVMFALESGMMLGLWSRQTVAPAADFSGSSSELAFPVANGDAVRATHADWRRRGLTIVQEPTAMDFGLTFVALDPDGHRLRVFAPNAP
jgi:predicted enzyme related to lactoylglutathione lyase